MSAKRIGGDWVENIDPTSGRKYYANVVTQETSWTWPEGLPAPEGEEGAASGNAGDWDEKLDPSSGRTYYFNRITQETTWTMPEGYQGSGAANAAANWQSKEDPSSGQTYYYNIVTEETTWERPACLDADPADAASPAADEEPAASSEAAADEGEAAGDVSGGGGGGGGEGGGDGEGEPNPEETLDKLDSLKSMKLTDEEETALDAEGAAEEGSSQASRSGAAVGGLPRQGELSASEQLLYSVTAKTSTEELRARVAEIKFVEYAEKYYNYDRKGIFSMRTTTDKITSWKGGNQTIKKSLLAFNDRDLEGEAVQCFRNVTGFMGDRSSNKNHMDHANKLLSNMLLSMEDLRNEVYCQICKQTKRNPSTESTVVGWQLMIICLACFPPGALLKDYLMAYCAENIDLGPPVVAQYAEAAMHCIDPIVKLGARRELPTSLEIEACKRLRPVTVRVSFLDHKYVMMPVNSWTTAEQFNECLCLRLGIHNCLPFAVFEVSSNDEERVLEPDERVLDLVAYWARLQADERAKKGKNAEVETFHFVFKVRLFFPVPDDDLSAVEMMYIQATHDVVDARYPCSEQDSITLAALQVQEQFGDHPGGECDYLTGNMRSYLAEKYLEDQDPSFLEAEVLNLYKKLTGYSQQEARLSYLDYVKSWKIYGSSYYFVEPQNHREFPHEVVLAINAKGILVVDPETKEFLQEFPYSQVVTWGYSANSFVVVTGNMVRQIKVYFKTEHGKEMNQIVRAYVEHLMNDKPADAEGAAETEA